jgi:hypothetical protein
MTTMPRRQGQSYKLFSFVAHDTLFVVHTAEMRSHNECKRAFLLFIIMMCTYEFDVTRSQEEIAEHLTELFYLLKRASKLCRITLQLFASHCHSAHTYVDEIN